MVFGIVIGLFVLAVVFFHYVQGFFSATLSAIIAVISAAVALGYYESLVEGPLAGYSPNWLPGLLIMGLFAVTYVILRTLFDKAVPGQIQLPAAADKAGGALMGLVAAAFGVGTVVVAAQHLPFDASMGGYARYETTGTRNTIVPPAGSGSGARSKDAATFDEMVDDRFDPAKKKKLLGGMLPIDDVVVSTVMHLSDSGSLGTGKPMKEVHPDLLEELFGQRVGMQRDASRAIVSTDAKPAISVSGVFRAPKLEPSQIVDHEFKKVRATPVKVPPLANDEARIVVRVRFTDAARDPQQPLIHLSPGSVRLVAPRTDPASGDLEPHNYYPIGTMDPSGIMYSHKMDDFLFVITPAPKYAGNGDAEGEVDFVFQVKEKGALVKGDGGAERLAPGTFIEVKKQARVDLSEGEAAAIKPWNKTPTLAIKRKNLNWEGGVAPSTPGKLATGGVAAPDAGQAPAPAAGGGGGAVASRLAGTWETRTGIQVSDTITFTPDGGMNSSKDGQLRWAASGNPQGDAFDITVSGGQAGNEKRSIQFIGDGVFEMTDAGGSNRRFTRVGAAPAVEAPAGTPAPAPAPAPSQANDPAMARMVGTWENANQFSYTFGADGKYTAADGKSGKSGGGTWRVAGTEGANVVNVELILASGKVNTQKWDLAGAEASPAQITRLAPLGEDGKPVPFNKK